MRKKEKEKEMGVVGLLIHAHVASKKFMTRHISKSLKVRNKRVFFTNCILLSYYRGVPFSHNSNFQNVFFFIYLFSKLVFMFVPEVKVTTVAIVFQAKTIDNIGFLLDELNCILDILATYFGQNENGNLEKENYHFKMVARFNKTFYYRLWMTRSSAKSYSIFAIIVVKNIRQIAVLRG